MPSVKTAFNGIALEHQEKKKRNKKIKIKPDPAYVFSKNHLYITVVDPSNFYNRQHSSIQIHRHEKNL